MTTRFAPLADPTPAKGAAEIRGTAGASEIVIRTTARLAGAIDSLTWNGREFIDSVDHGRQLQSAASFDLADFPTYWPECFNPTEAGSRADHTGSRSSSRLMDLHAAGNRLETTTQMAFWLAPGEASSGHPARNRAVLSEHRLHKQVQIGIEGLPHAIRYDVVFTVPAAERHTYAQFEALTGYMPPEFEQCWQLDLRAGRLAPLSWGPGEQSYPVVLSTRSGSHAMGVYSPDQPSPGYAQAGYGRFQFERERVNKWNCVFRVRNPDGIPTGDYAFQMYVAVGTRDDVEQTLRACCSRFPGRGKAPS